MSTPSVLPYALSPEKMVSAPVDRAALKEATVLVTGATGFIGGWVARSLLGLGSTVRALVRTSAQAEAMAAQGLHPVLADLAETSQDLLTREMKGCDFVVHSGAWTGDQATQDQGWEINVQATYDLTEAARRARVRRFLFISSVAVYGLNAAPLIDESAPVPPVGQLYPLSKIAAESTVMGCGIPWTIIRPASTFGPLGTAWSLRPIELIKENRLRLLGRDDGLVNPGYIENFVPGLLAALTVPQAAGEIFNLCDGYTVTYRTWYLRHARMVGRDRLPTLPGGVLALANTPFARLARRLVGRPAIGPWSVHFRRNPSRFSIDKARRLLGYDPRIDFDTAMQRTEDWLRAAGHVL
jgi:nucleoside-diphosphate-sugar epimerase